jgi:ferrous iron transport protein B
MPTKSSASLLTVALVGNPNTGKSTLFSALAGVRQRIGNYPGVTVEKKIGHMNFAGRRFELVDLPGTYSLAPRSPDEMVAVDVLLARRDDVRPVDAVLSIVDASNLERNLYLVSQVLELGLPTIVVLNMVDVARARGVSIDVARLREQLGVPVVEVQANKRIGIGELQSELSKVVESPAAAPPSPLPPEFQAELSRLEPVLLTHGAAKMPRYLVERLLLDSAGYLEGPFLDGWYGEDHAAAIRPELAAARARLAEAGSPVPAVEAVSRYGWVGRVLEGVVSRPKQRVVTRGDAIDRVLTHRFFGAAIFALLMLVVFSSIFLWAAPLMGLVETGVDWVSSSVKDLMPEGALRSLVVDGVIGGVGSVLIFLPQIMILFFFIAVLEDCGYMARAAYLMDRLMVRVGLSGKSFIPLLSSFACAIPGVMATRVIENRRDRLTTILVAPLMSCSARLPVYTILIAAFIPARKLLGLVPLQGLTLLAMYLIGIVAATLVALVLKRTLLRGPTPPFVMELPSYKWPSPKLVAWRVLERAWGFVYRAGTLILAVSIVVWAAQYYPRDEQAVAAPYRSEQADLKAELESPDFSPAEHEQAANRLAAIDHDIAAQYQQQSYLGQMGHFIEPAVRPLGWDWRIGCAAIASFPAREVVMGALGVLYNLGSGLDVAEEGDQNRLVERLRAARRDDTAEPVYNIPVALSIMVFFALCAQCASTLVVIKRETASWGWPIFTFFYMTTLAYLAALATYQIGMRIG